VDGWLCWHARYVKYRGRRGHPYQH
jgi:hypothetical protein